MSEEAGPDFHFTAITKISKFRQPLLLLALGVLSGAPHCFPGSFHWDPKALWAPSGSCSSGGVNGWLCCRIWGGESVPSHMDSFSCFLWHQELHPEPACWKRP